MRPQERWKRIRPTSVPKGHCRHCGKPITQGRSDRAWHDGRPGEPHCVALHNARYLWWNSTAYVRARVYARDRGICALCNRDCGENAWEADHRRPLRDGGRHSMANLQTLCPRCHKRKTAREARARAIRKRRLRH